MGLHVWRALGLWTHRSPVVSMLTRPLSASSVRWLSGDLLVKAVVRRGQSWQQRNVKPRCVGGMQSSRRKGGEEHGLHGQWVRILTPGAMVPLPPGVTGLWKKTGSLQPQLPLRLALRNGRKSEASCKKAFDNHTAGPSETPNQQPR